MTDGTLRVLVDPMALDPAGTTTLDAMVLVLGTKLTNESASTWPSLRG